MPNKVKPLSMARIAFYAPLKPPDHPIPSGDRQMAIMLFSALEKAGFQVELASRAIAYSKRHGKEHMDARIEAALKEADHLIAKWSDPALRPDLWFCYHPYDKSPDWLGMKVCEALEIPMVTAEPCKTGQGPNGEWLAWRQEAQRGILMADLNIVMTQSDLDYLNGFVAKERIAWMPPFIDESLLVAERGFDAATAWSEPDKVKLLSVGMMRPGAKLESYQVLANSLRQVKSRNWQLAIAGGGPKKEDVRALFEFAGDQVTLLGEKAPGEVVSLMQACDVLTWPGCREAYGMVFLEAAAQAKPSVALNTMGVPLVVEDNRTGLLATPPDVATYTNLLERIIEEPELREKLGRKAKHFATGERSVDQSAVRLKDLIEQVLETH